MKKRNKKLKRQPMITAMNHSVVSLYRDKNGDIIFNAYTTLDCAILNVSFLIEKLVKGEMEIYREGEVSL